MKYISLFFCVVIFGCVDNGVKVANDAQSGSAGKISFALSKTSIPQDIASLTFTLTNLSTSETVSKTLVVSTDTVMQVEFDQLTVGAWHVKVVAKDSTSGTKYSGESDANVIEGQTTQLSLSLSTLTSGVGTLVITVNWPGMAPFVDYSGNPVLGGTGAWYDSRGIAYATVFPDSGTYKMYFMSYGTIGSLAYTTIGLAESVDGTTWTRVADTVLTPTSGSWDNETIAPGSVIKENGVYTMYYYGGQAGGINFSIGKATSQDGIHWTKKPAPVLSNQSNIRGGAVVKANNQYYMYYTTSPASSVRLATSSDGENWQVYSGNPVLSTAQAWEGSVITCGNVICENGTFTMIYYNSDYSQSFGLATSTDGIHWMKDTRNPVMTPLTPSNGWASSVIAYPILARVGTQLRIYYTGVLSNGPFRIGYAVKR